MKKGTEIFNERLINRIKNDYIAGVSDYGHIYDYIITKLELEDPDYDGHLGGLCADLLAETLSCKLEQCGK